MLSKNSFMFGSNCDGCCPASENYFYESGADPLNTPIVSY